MRILFLSDEPVSAQTIAGQINRTGNDYTVEITSWPICSPSVLQDAELVLIHLHSNVEGRDLAALRRTTSLPLFLLSAIGDEEILSLLYAAGIDDYLALPLSYPLLMAKLRVWERWVTSSPTHAHAMSATPTSE